MYFRSKEDKNVNSDQKILIAALTEFQTKLEKVDTYDHIVFPPVYKQVSLTYKPFPTQLTCSI